MKVKKRDGRSEDFNIEKIHDVLFWATKDIKGVNVSDIEINTSLQIFDDIETTKIHEVLIYSAADLISESTPNYQIVAANLLNYYLRKQVFGVSDNMPSLLNVIKKNIEYGVYDKEILSLYTEEEIEQLDKFIRHNRDYLFVYAGLQQLVDKYLLKDRSTSKIYETPQYMYMLIAMILNSNEGDNKLKAVKSFYNDISTFEISLPTPIMCGVRTPSRQYSSCTLIDVGDSLPSIFHSNTAVGYYTANRAGIGLNFGRIRGVGSKIRNGEVVHTGVIPFLKMFESTTKCCTQNGVRGGSSTTHFPFWHKEIEDILVLKNNRGTDDNRVRKMDYSIQFNRLFYKRFVEDGKITLFTPHEVPDLYEAFFGDTEEFVRLYEKYERSRSIFKREVPARKLFMHFCQERIETGRMYVMNVDNTNEHSSFLDTVYMSNLCQEITLPTTPITHIDSEEDGEIALCILSAINVGALRKLEDLESISYNIVRSLDYIIDNQLYPVDASKKMKKRRSIGVGVTNLAYYLAKNSCSYEDKEAIALVDELAESIQYYLLKASVRLAKERGKCEWFDRTKYSQGILPIDTYSKEVDKICKRKLTHDWEKLRKEIKEHGLRNSTLTALMPCESSSLVTNSTNGIEPPRSLVTIKKSKQGLIPQVVPEIAKLKNKYTLAYDMKDNNGYINICAVLQKYFDQAISANHYYNFAKYEEGNLPMSVVAKDVLYSYKMGLKTLYYANTDDGKTDTIGEDDSDCAGGACKL
jgi:ribonucleoside-diphosphate reductase alpha chain